MIKEKVLFVEETKIVDLSNRLLVSLILMISIFVLLTFYDIPVGLYNLSKSFKPNLATIRILSVGTKFIPKSKKENEKDTFRNVEKFRKKLSNTVF